MLPQCIELAAPTVWLGADQRGPDSTHREGRLMAVTSLQITGRTPFADGQSFDNTGPYQYLEGKAHFLVAPLHDSNEAITA